MSNPSILILDDDEMWLARHERRLTQAGFRCFATQKAKQAIDLGKSETSIKFALIDEILFVPPVPKDESQAELQRWQGSGVIREISALRRDIQFIVIASAPQLRSQGDLQLFTRETSKLRRQPHVIDIMHKQDIEADPDPEYRWLIDEIFNRSQHNFNQQTQLKPRVLVGLGVDPAIYSAAAEQLDRARTTHLPLASLLKNLDKPEPVIKEFLSRSQEKCIFIEAPGSKKRDRTRLKESSQSYQILETLAIRSELKQAVTFRETDYKYNPRGDDQPYAIDPNNNAIEHRAYAYQYTDGRVQQSAGVQIESRKTESRLKTAIHRLKKDLVIANVAPLDTLFDFTNDGYSPTFELGIILYAIKPKKPGRSRPPKT